MYDDVMAKQSILIRWTCRIFLAVNITCLLVVLVVWPWSYFRKMSAEYFAHEAT
jgi:hypothetical protein